MPNFYEILGVSSVLASGSEIERAYRARVKSCHFAKSTDSKNSEDDKDFSELRAVEEAYATLGNLEAKPKYDKDFKGIQDVFLSTSLAVSAASGEQDSEASVNEEKFNLRELMNQAGGVSTEHFIEILELADEKTVLALLDNDEVAKKLKKGGLLIPSEKHGKNVIKKILETPNLYQHLEDKQVVDLARSSPEACQMVLNTPDLSQKLDGSLLKELRDHLKGSSEEAVQGVCEKILRLERYQAYLQLAAYPYRPWGLKGNIEEEGKEILAWAKTAGLKRPLIASNGGERAALKALRKAGKLLLSDLTPDDLAAYARVNGEIASELISQPDLLRKLLASSLPSLPSFSLPSSYHDLYELCMFDLSVCKAVLNHPSDIQVFDGGTWASLCRYHYSHYSRDNNLGSLILDSKSVAKKSYQAYLTLKNNELFFQSADSAAVRDFYTLCAQVQGRSELSFEQKQAYFQKIVAVVGSKEGEIKQLLRDYSRFGSDTLATSTSSKNSLLALVLLKHNLRPDLVIEGNRWLIPFLIANRHLFTEVFHSQSFVKHLIKLSNEQERLQILSFTDLHPFVTGESLSNFQSSMVYDKILEYPALTVRCLAYNKLRKVLGQGGVRVIQGQAESTAIDLSGKQAYECGLFAQEKGCINHALHYFQQARQEGYKQADEAITRLKNEVRCSTPHRSHLKAWAGFAKALSDPQNPHYDEQLAFNCYHKLLQCYKQDRPILTPEEQANYFKVIYAVYYYPWRSLECKPFEALPHKFFEDIYGSDQGQRLLTLCAEDRQYRRGRQPSSSAALTEEPAVLFLQAKLESLNLPLEDRVKICLNLANFSLKEGFSAEAQEYFEKAAQLSPDRLTSVEWNSLGSLQQGKVVLLLAQEASSDLLFPACNRALSSFLRGAKAVSPSAPVSVEADAKRGDLSPTMAADAKESVAKLQARASRDKEGNETLALALIHILFEKPLKRSAEGPEPLSEAAGLDSENAQLMLKPRAGLSPENAGLILANSSLCERIASDSEPEFRLGSAVLYAICCLGLEPPVLPPAPPKASQPLQTKVKGGESKPLEVDVKAEQPESLDQPEDYIATLIDWAAAEQKAEDAAPSTSSSIDRLLILMELFLKGRNDEPKPYQPYLLLCLEKLFKNLALGEPSDINTVGLSKQLSDAADALFARAQMGVENALVVEKLRKLADQTKPKAPAPAQPPLDTKPEGRSLPVVLSPVSFIKRPSASPQIPPRLNVDFHHLQRVFNRAAAFRARDAGSTTVFRGEPRSAAPLDAIASVQWRRLFLIFTLACMVLSLGASAVLFFVCALPWISLLCLGVAGLCALGAGYQVLASRKPVNDLHVRSEAGDQAASSTFGEDHSWPRAPHSYSRGPNATVSNLRRPSPSR